MLPQLARTTAANTLQRVRCHGAQNVAAGTRSQSWHTAEFGSRGPGPAVELSSTLVMRVQLGLRQMMSLRAVGCARSGSLRLILLGFSRLSKRGTCSMFCFCDNPFVASRGLHLCVDRVFYGACPHCTLRVGLPRRCTACGGMGQMLSIVCA